VELIDVNVNPLLFYRHVELVNLAPPYHDCPGRATRTQPSAPRQ